MEDLLLVLDYAAEWLVGLIIFIGVAQNLVSLLQLFVAMQSLKEADIHDRNEGLWQRTAPGATPIALIAPAYNEANTIVESLKSLLSLHYPFYEVIVVNDGSRDNTLQILIDNFDLKPSPRAYDLEVTHKPIRQIYQSPRFKNLVVIDKENGGKASVRPSSPAATTAAERTSQWESCSACRMVAAAEGCSRRVRDRSASMRTAWSGSLASCIRQGRTL